MRALFFSPFLMCTAFHCIAQDCISDKMKIDEILKKGRKAVRKLQVYQDVINTIGNGPDKFGMEVATRSCQNKSHFTIGGDTITYNVGCYYQGIPDFFLIDYVIYYSIKRDKIIFVCENSVSSD